MRTLAVFFLIDVARRPALEREGAAQALDSQSHVGRADRYSLCVVLFATSLTGLVGGVFAAAIGAVPRVTRRRSDRATDDRVDPWRTRLAAAYVIAYAVAGITATIVCIARLGSATPLLQSLAGAFMGASAAAASAFFGVADQPRRS